MFNVIVQKGSTLVNIKGHTLLSDAVEYVDEMRQVYDANENVSTDTFPDCRIMYRNDAEKVLISVWKERPFCS